MLRHIAAAVLVVVAAVSLDAQGQQNKSAANQFGGWSYRATKNPMTDKKDVFCSLASVNATINYIGEAKSATLTLSVREGKFNVAVIMPRIITQSSINSKTVVCRIRFDEDEPSKITLKCIAPSNTAFFDDPSAILAQLLARTKFTIDVPPNIVWFNLDGLSAVVAQIEADTGVKLTD